MASEENKLLTEDEYDEDEDEGNGFEDVVLPLYLKYKTPVCLLGALIFYVLGAVFMKYSEDWHYLTSFYVITQIITTVGYGDLTVTSDATRIFMTFYVLWCIICVSAILTDVSNMMLEREAQICRGELAATEARADGDEPEDTTCMHKYHLNSLLISVVVFLFFAVFGAVFYANYEKCACSYGTTMANNYVGCTDAGPAPNCALPQFGEGTPTHGRTINLAEGFYMAIITMTTVGFGDFTPLSHMGRAVGIFWMIFGVLATGHMVSAIATTMQAVTQRKKQSIKSSRKELLKIAGNKTSLSRAEFLHFTLIKHGRIDQKDVDSADRVFNVMSKNSPDGNISLDEVEFHFAHDEAE